MADERIVIDTNVLISGLFSTTSAPARALERAVAEGQLVAASDTLGELTAKLLSPTFDQYVSLEARYARLQRLVAVVDVVDVIQRVRASRDPRTINSSRLGQTAGRC